MSRKSIFINLVAACGIMVLLLFDAFPSLADEITIMANQSGVSSVCLTWTYDEPYDFFELYRYDNDGNSWKKIKNVYECSAYNYNLEQGINYKYRIRPSYNGEFGDYSSEVSFGLGQKIGTPSLLEANQSGTTKVKLTWEEVSGADRYDLYRSLDNETWKKIKSVTNPYAENYNLEENQTYYYKVIAISGNDYSNYSNVVSFRLNSSTDAPLNFSVETASQASVFLSWDAVDNVDSYILYRSEDGINWKKIKNISGTSTYNYNLEGKTYYYKICANVLYAPFSEVVEINMELPSAPENLTAEGRDNLVSLSWDAVENADGYMLYRSVDGGNFKGVKTTDIPSTYNYNLEEGKSYQYYVVAYKTALNKKIYGAKSQTVTYSINKQNNENDVENNTKYRALLIGETNYAQTLSGPDNDIEAMNDILTKSGYEVYSELDATKADIVDLIDSVFIDATEDDVSLFYYSGHGVVNSGEYYAGALQTVDYSYITTEELAELLYVIPGKVIVILDSCGSGAAISTGNNDDFSMQKFNESVVKTFSLFDEATTFSGELRQPKFAVLTGSAYEQNSVTMYINGVWGGILTRGISSATGRDYNAGEWNEGFLADSNNDNIITMDELYIYCYSYAKDMQDVQ